MKRLITLLIMILLPACTSVKPWEKGILSKPEMSLDPLPMESALTSHIYFSKEASSGGLSAAGGGCGCN